jgi:hypothetical protein
MVQPASQPIYQLFASLLAVVPFLLFVAAFLIALPSHLAARAARKLIPAKARAMNPSRNAAALRDSKRRSF